MWGKCEKCGRNYDDTACWTICPHGPLGFAHDEYCLKCDTLKRVHGPCRHQQPSVAAEDLGETAGR